MIPRFILASQSPRRKELLSQVGLKFDVIPAQIDENAYNTDGIGAAEYTRILSKAKALDVALRHPNQLVIAADCVVSLNEKIIGKPKDAADAEEIIRLIFSEPHEVITSVSFIAVNSGVELTETEGTIVYPKTLTDELIDKHIASGKWQDKAGAYGIQDEQADDFIDRIEGSYSNVVGMPMETTLEILEELFGEQLIARAL